MKPSSSIVAAGIVALLLTGPVAGAQTRRGGAERRETVIYDARGVALGYLMGEPVLGWEVGFMGQPPSGECWVRRGDSTRPARTFYAGVTHNTNGGAVPVRARGPTTVWKIWWGRGFLGTAVLRTHLRADLYARSGRKIGRTTGPDPIAAAAAAFLLAPIGDCS